VRRVVTIVYLFILWFLLTWAWNAQSLIVGGVVALSLGLVYGRLFATDTAKILQPKRWLWFGIYIPIFVWEMAKANFDVAYRVVHPKMPIRPGIVKVRTRIKSELGRVFLANSITLTPGTFTIDIKGEYLYIHWLFTRCTGLEEASQAIVGPFEKYIIKIFD